MLLFDILAHHRFSRLNDAVRSLTLTINSHICYFLCCFLCRIEWCPFSRNIEALDIIMLFFNLLCTSFLINNTKISMFYFTQYYEVQSIRDNGILSNISNESLCCTHTHTFSCNKLKCNLKLWSVFASVCSVCLVHTLACLLQSSSQLKEFNFML